MQRGKRRAEIGIAGMGMDLAASVGVGALLGWWLDRRFDTTPWATIVCSTIGIVGGLVNFIRKAQRAARASQRNAQEARRESRELPEKGGE
jgi:ATP synthase protein I